MAVPTHKTSKSKRNKRRSHHALKGPTISFNAQTGEYSQSHHYTPKKIEQRRGR